MKISTLGRGLSLPYSIQYTSVPRNVNNCKYSPDFNLKCILFRQNVSGSFDDKGWSQCRDGYFITGLYRSGGNSLFNLEQFKCCKMYSSKFPRNNQNKLIAAINACAPKLFHVPLNWSIGMAVRCVYHFNVFWILIYNYFFFNFEIKPFSLRNLWHSRFVDVKQLAFQLTPIVLGLFVRRKCRDTQF